MLNIDYMEITTTTINRNPGRRAAVNTLAVIGFIALLIIGIGLAIYSARNFPKLSSRLNGAAVVLSSIFHAKDEQPTLNVVTATTTLPIGAAVAATTTATTTTATHTSGGAIHAGSPVTTVVTTTPTPVAPYGNPDLAVTVTDVGYTMQPGDTSTFTGSNDVPSGKNGAIKFSVTNVGTNVSGNWTFAVDIPTSPSQHFVAPMQESLNPGDRIDFVVGFDRGYDTGKKTITVTVDPDNRTNDINKSNNVSTRWVVVD